MRRNTPTQSNLSSMRACRSLQGHRRIASARLGMTLLELLIVLSIISVLAALLMPVFSTVREASHRSVCLNNLHQSGLAISLYADDYDQQYPTFLADKRSAVHPRDFVYWHDHFCRATHPQPGQVTWVSLVKPYVSRSKDGQYDSDAIFHCPSDRDLEARPDTSYEFKMWLAEGQTSDSVSSPAGVVLLWEQWAFHSDGMESEHDRRARMNVLFMDGHTSWIRLADTTSALYGDGPDLHWIFSGSPEADGRDIPN